MKTTRITSDWQIETITDDGWVVSRVRLPSRDAARQQPSTYAKELRQLGIEYNRSRA